MGYVKAFGVAGIFALGSAFAHASEEDKTEQLDLNIYKRVESHLLAVGACGTWDILNHALDKEQFQEVATLIIIEPDNSSTKVHFMVNERKNSWKGIMQNAGNFPCVIDEGDNFEYFSKETSTLVITDQIYMDRITPQSQLCRPLIEEVIKGNAENGPMILSMHMSSFFGHDMYIANTDDGEWLMAAFAGTKTSGEIVCDLQITWGQGFSYNDKGMHQVFNRPMPEAPIIEVKFLDCPPQRPLPMNTPNYYGRVIGPEQEIKVERSATFYVPSDILCNKLHI